MTSFFLIPGGGGGQVPPLPPPAGAHGCRFIQRRVAIFACFSAVCVVRVV